MLRRSFFAIAALLISWNPMFAFSASTDLAGIHRTESVVTYPFNLVIVAEPATVPAVPRMTPRTPNAHSAVYRCSNQPVQTWRHVADCFRYIDPGRNVSAA